MSTSAGPTDASPKKTYRTMAGMAVAAIVLIGIAIYSLQQLSSPVRTSSLADLALQPSAPRDLPNFDFAGDGKTLKHENLAGHWTLLTFWAHWCAPCLEEMPALNALSQQWQGADFEIVTVNEDDPRSENFEAARTFLSEQNIVLPTLFDRKGELKAAFGVEELPRHFLISPDLKIVWQGKGAFRWNDTKARDELMRAMGDEAFHESAEGETDMNPDGTTATPPAAAPDAPAAEPAK